MQQMGTWMCLNCMKKYNKYRNRFEFVLDSALLKSIAHQALLAKTCRNRIVVDALQALLHRYRRGFVSYTEKSNFLNRPDNASRVRFEALLSANTRNMLARLATGIGISQAEVVRVALEYYLFVLVGKNMGIDFGIRKIYFRKNRNYGKSLVPALIAFQLFQVEDRYFYLIHNPPRYKVVFLK